MATQCAEKVIPAGRGLEASRRSAQAQACGLLAVLLGIGVGLWLVPGCSKDARQTGQNVRSVTVRTVSHYGMTLDEEASPEQVAYVLLRAIHDDFRAVDDTARDTALDIQFDLCAANEIAGRNHTSLTRDEFIHNVVSLWTTTVSHYVGGFEPEWEKAEARFHRRMGNPPVDAGTDAAECEILMEVADPGGDPNAGAVMALYLVKDSGYWRVMHLGFEPAKRSIKRLKSKPTGGG